MDSSVYNSLDVAARTKSHMFVITKSIIGVASPSKLNGLQS